jgi:hypothetical protein
LRQWKQLSFSRVLGCNVLLLPPLPPLLLLLLLCAA